MGIGAAAAGAAAGIASAVSSAAAGITAGGALAAASAVTGLVGAGIGAYGSISSANATAANASYQAQVAKNNQIAANQNAAYATAAGNAKATQQSEMAAQKLGRVRAGLAASGVDVNSGSAAEDTETQRETGTLDTLTTVNNAALQAYGYRVTGENFGAQAGLDTAEAAQAPEAGALSGSGGLLSSISSLGDKYLEFQKQAGNTSTPTPVNPQMGGLY